MRSDNCAHLRRLIKWVQNTEDNKDLAYALCMAINERFNNCAELLINAGVSVSFSLGGDTALSFASKCGNARLMRMLLEQGADPNVESIDGWQPLTAAYLNESMDIVRLLLCYGADPNLFGWAERSLLAIATDRCDIVAIDLFLVNGADIDGVSDDGLTPMLMAARSGLLTMVCAFVERKANIAHVSEYGTALHLAAKNGHLDIVEYLVANGADVDSYEYWDVLGCSTPRSLAERNGHLDVAKFLFECSSMH